MPDKAVDDDVHMLLPSSLVPSSATAGRSASGSFVQISEWTPDHVSSQDCLQFNDIMMVTKHVSCLQIQGHGLLKDLYPVSIAL